MKSVKKAEDIVSVFTSIPGCYLILLPDAPLFTIVEATDAYLAATYCNRDEIIGMGVFQALTDNPQNPQATGVKNLSASLHAVLEQKCEHRMANQRYDVYNPVSGAFEIRVWRPFNKPVLREDGSVQYIIHTVEDITDSLQLEENNRLVSQQLHDSEYRFRSMIEQAPVAFAFTRGRDMIIESVNHRMLQIMNKGSEEEVLGKNLIEVLPVVREHLVSQFILNVLETGVPFMGNEIPLELFVDGKIETHYFDISFTPVWEKGVITSVLHSAIDVTEKVLSRKKLEESEAALRQSEKQKSFLLHLSDHLRTLGDSEEIQNEAAALVGKHLEADRVGYAEDGGDGKTVVVTRDYTNDVFSLVGSYSYDDYGPELLQAFQEGRTVVRNNIQEDPSLTAEEKEAHATLQLGATVNVPLLRDGKLMAIFFIHFREPHNWSENEVFLMKEVAERTWEAVVRARAEQALRQSEEALEKKVQERTRELENQKNLLNNILVNSSNGISVSRLFKNEAGEVVDALTILANDAAVNFIGLPKEIYLTRKARELDPEILKSPYGLMCLHTQKTGEPSFTQYFFEPANRWLELTVSKMDDDHLIHIFTDVTPIKEAQLQLERSVEELRRSNQNLEEFAYAASHDMKEPIRKIHFFSDRLKERLKGKLEDEDRRYFERMEMGARRMTSLIDDLLMYSHVSRGINSEEPVDLNQTLTFVLDDLELQIEEKHARVEISPLPTIKGHQRQLQQLFENLLGNALKYSKADVLPHIEITYRRVNGSEVDHVNTAIKKYKLYHLIEVKDNGIGFDQEDASRIFNVFTRLHGNTEYRGTGIGLSIAQKVVQNHGGYIWAEAKPGEGSIFSLLLPAE